MQLAKVLSFIWNHPLNQGHRWAAIGRFLRWQLASRMIHSKMALPFVDDTFLFAQRGMTGATGNWYCGLDEVNEMGFVLHCLRHGDLFVDVGANVGSFTVLAAGGAGAKVLAVEPVPIAFAHLEMNIALNRLGDMVEAHRIGLSKSRGTLRFTADLDSVNHVATEDDVGETVDVVVRTLDELCPSHDPTIIKIDVEGHEFAVLAGADKSLQSQSLLGVILEINGQGERYGHSDRELFELMGRYDFEPAYYEPLTRQLIRGTSGRDNVIFIRNFDDVESRLASAGRFNLVNRQI